MKLANQKELSTVKAKAKDSKGARYVFVCRDCPTKWVDSDLDWMIAATRRHAEGLQHHVIKALILGLDNGEEYVPPT